jgi:hypothetical protein
MKITRKDAVELADEMLEQIISEGYHYWITYKNKTIPYATCMYVLKQFAENPSLSIIELSDIHFK